VVYVGRDMDVTHRKELELQLAAAREAAERRAEEAETLRQVGIILASAMSVEDAIEAVLDQASRVIPYQSAGVYMAKDEVVRLVGGSDAPCDISVDLVSQDEHIGRLDLCTDGGHVLDERQMELLHAFADQVAVALRASRLYDETLALAMTDSLTGLSTRRAFEHLASHRIALAKRNEAPVAVMMIDIDYFKQLNDCYGHAAGDIVLQAVGEAFRETLRKSDEGCRFGGDEFLILLPATDVEQALLVAERLRDSLRRLAPLEFGSLSATAPNGVPNTPDAPQEVSLSVGISCKNPGEYRSIVDFLVTADQALYAAKRDGRDRIYVLEGCPDHASSG
jgi:diguanylate cyclase (GGDEF)-like protein